MPYRNLTYWNLVPTARIIASAFEDEALMGIHIHPYRDRYPDDMYLFYLRALRIALFSGPDNVHLVSYNDAGGREQLTGYAHWTRKRRIPKPVTLYDRLMQGLFPVYNRIEAIFWSNRAIEPSRANILEHLDPLIQNHLIGDREECWYLALLAVDPIAHKSGHGKLLLSYGLKQAKEEDIPAGLVSSQGAEGFYKKCGFDVELGRIGTEKGEDNPLKDIDGGQIFFTR